MIRFNGIRGACFLCRKWHGPLEPSQCLR